MDPELTPEGMEMAHAFAKAYRALESIIIQLTLMSRRRRARDTDDVTQLQEKHREVGPFRAAFTGRPSVDECLDGVGIRGGRWRRQRT